MKILVDAGVGILSEQWLSEAGPDVLSIRTLDPSLADRDILAIAVSEHRLVDTMDKDFGELVFREAQGHFGVVLLRLNDATGIQRRDAIAEIFTRYAERLPGRFSVFKKALLRTRS